MKEKALRNTQISTIHELGELKRAQELRVDAKIERKSWHDTETHFTNTRIARKGELHEWFRRISRGGIELQWKISHVPSQQAVIPSLPSMLSRDRRLPLDTWNLSEPQGNVWGNPRPLFDSSQTLYQGILHATTPSATGAVPVQVSTGQLVARGEERIGSTTTMPMSERRPSTMNSSLPVEIPQNSMAGQQRLQISELQFV